MKQPQKYQNKIQRNKTLQDKLGNSMHFVEFSVQMDEAARNNPDKLWILKTTKENGHIDDLSIFLTRCSTFNLKKVN